ncbi:hypothetical protein DFQ27_000330 [Actinomortierella ambigua]|uniref:Uncharacterized protein n=1 Tax=Actinomortierella ambigua TaxID=1343610 RepID=A0A9P6PNY9_9FUNG|nr:hypothetical protein DFQ26_001649 [Actinomortierella ambigua]KAG0249148.1 hypothetical protein DFQ27_000330 [Actinomortierella ambigua]
MAQKAPKKSNVQKNAVKKQGTGIVKKGARAIAPKKSVLVKQAATQKKLSTQINKNIENVIAARAGATGKLTIMKKVADAGIAAERKAGGRKTAGGTPKFTKGKTTK